MSHHLPKDLIMNIFQRLPIKSTVRFRCLSRSWYSPLSQRDFIYQNLIRRHPDDDDDDTDLFVLRYDRDTGNLVYSFVSAGTLVSSPIHDYPDPAIDSEVIETYSCNGLICYYYGSEDGIAIVVWNPATGEAKILPPLRISCFCHSTRTLGFGFDAQKNDYKIVTIENVVYHTDNAVQKKAQLEAYVYSLKGENGWRKLDEAPDVSFSVFASQHARWSAYKNGRFYWIAANRGIVGKYRDANEGLQIVSFDMTNEVFESTPVVCPPFKYAKDMGAKYFCSFFPLKESIAAVLMDHERLQERCFEIWALLQPGEAESWAKLYDLEWLSLRGVYRSVGYWRNHLIFQTLNGQLLLCDPSNSEHETQTIQIDAEESLPFHEACELSMFAPEVFIFPYKPSHMSLDLCT